LYCSSTMEETVGVLEGTLDNFGGIIVDVQKLPSDRATFEKMLPASLVHWQQEKRRGIWLMIPAEKVELVPVAVKNSFVFHHAEPEYVLLTRWLPLNEPNKLPAYASHTIGVGGFVLNDKNEVLVISERYGEKKWKLPGGYVTKGETLGQAAIREVKEECGIDCEFLSVVCFRHMHPLQFNSSDIYFVCRLKPLTFELVPEEAEILECKWLALDKYMNDPNVNSLNQAVAKLVANNSSKNLIVADVGPLEGWAKKKTVYDFYQVS